MTGAAGASSGPPCRGARDRGASAPSFLVLLCTACLVGVYYALRADVIGVYSPSRGWVPMTYPPLDVARHCMAAVLVLGIAPVAAARLSTGFSLGELGLGLGRGREGARWLAVGLPLAVLAGWVGSHSAALRAVYPLDAGLDADPGRFLPYALVQLGYFASWEVLFRGVLLFALRPRTGAGLANALQTALSVTAHFGRALDETGAALGAGVVFGWVAMRTGSVWYGAVIHWVVGVSQDWFVVNR
ncbi:MAG TPA: CPBP family intramembrane glutamic endopeptidase [Gemmatimonadales bacterium]|nr:CPBP family intramembrane glutamic endopeptidase [Gemmatimonadales bacterium]